jgi:hypothetical protein
MLSITSSSPATHLSVAGILLTRLAEADFDRLGDVFEPDLRAIVMLPAGVFEWPDPATVCAVFEQWFGDVDEYDVTDFAVSRVGSRTHLRWRIVVSGGHLDEGRYVVDQQLYADLGPTGRIGSMSMLCSGFCRENERR